MTDKKNLKIHIYRLFKPKYIPWINARIKQKM